MVVLLGLGIAVAVFGAFVLVRFPERPGGTISWKGLNISSKGAGLPLIALGVAAAAFAVVRGPAGPLSSPATSSGSNAVPAPPSTSSDGPTSTGGAGAGASKTCAPGERAYPIASVDGGDFTEADARANINGFYNVRARYVTEHPGKPDDRVVAQEPAAGTLWCPGAPVTLTVTAPAH